MSIAFVSGLIENAFRLSSKMHPMINKNVSPQLYSIDNLPQENIFPPLSFTLLLPCSAFPGAPWWPEDTRRELSTRQRSGHQVSLGKGSSEEV